MSKNDPKNALLFSSFCILPSSFAVKHQSSCTAGPTHVDFRADCKPLQPVQRLPQLPFQSRLIPHDLVHRRIVWQRRHRPDATPPRASPASSHSSPFPAAPSPACPPQINPATFPCTPVRTSAAAPCRRTPRAQLLQFHASKPYGFPCHTTLLKTSCAIFTRLLHHCQPPFHNPPPASCSRRPIAPLPAFDSLPTPTNPSPPGYLCTSGPIAPGPCPRPISPASAVNTRRNRHRKRHDLVHQQLLDRPHRLQLRMKPLMPRRQFPPASPVRPIPAPAPPSTPSPCFSAFIRDTALPSGVLGPVDFRQFRRFRLQFFLRPRPAILLSVNFHNNIWVLMV